MSNIKYWLSVFIGFLFVLIAYKYKPFGIETFAVVFMDPSLGANLYPNSNSASSISAATPSTSTSTSTNTSTSSGTISSGPISGGPISRGPISGSPSNNTKSSQNNSYCGDNILPLPYPKNMLLYFNSFNATSLVPGVGNMNTTYQCNGNKPNYWCDANNSSIQYFLNGQVIPSSMPNSGLQMKNMMIAGPPATSVVNTNITPLSSFSLVFYMKINSITFETPADIILYEMYAATPNMVRVSIAKIPNDPSNVEINIIVGPISKIYSWLVPVTTLLSSGNNTTFAIIYDITSVPSQATLSFYIGAGGNGNIWNMQTPEYIYLSDLGITFNKNQNLDAALLAFCYYNCVINPNDVKTIDNYFLSEASGICAFENALSVTASALSSQNSGLLNLLNSASSSINTLETQINKLSSKSCPASIKPISAPAPSGPMWQINMNGASSVSNTDLDKCSPLTLKEFDISMPSSPMPNIQATANVVNKAIFASQSAAAPAKSPSSAPSKSPYSAPAQPPSSAPAQPPYSAPSKASYSAPAQPPYSAPSKASYSAPAQPPYSAPSKSPSSA